jgi:hypothetical protein
MSMIETTDIERRIAERIDPRVTGALSVSREAGGLAFTNASEAMEFAKMMALSRIGVRKHLRDNVGACLSVVIQSIEWGMSPFAVANKSYLVNDQIAYESQLVQAVILRRAPIKGRFKYTYSGEGDRRRCKVVAELRDGEIVEYESPEIGKIPVKNSPLWKGDPDQQLAYYSGRALCRRHFPDVLLGIYDIDELPHDTPRDPSRARDVTPRPTTLAGRLDALAAPREPEPAHDSLRPGEADPETGEITQDDSETGAEGDAASQAAGAASGDRDSAAAASAADQPTEEVDDRTEDEKLIDAARAKSLEGRRSFDAWFNRLRPEQIDALNPHMKSLMAAAKQADGRA